MQLTVVKVFAHLLGLGLLGQYQMSQATPFYSDLLWDGHSHVDIGSGGNETRPDRIAGAINGAAAGTSIQGYSLPQDLPGVGRIMLFPKKHLDNYMLTTLVTADELTNPDRLITAIGFQNDPKVDQFNVVIPRSGWRDYPISASCDLTEQYDPGEDLFLNDVETRAASGSYQWLGEVALYGQEAEVEADIKADLFHHVIEERIRRVLMIAARYSLPVTIHHTVTTSNGDSIQNMKGTCGVTDTAREHFLNILRAHAIDVINDPQIDDPATVIWAHWGGLSDWQEIQDMIKEFPNLYFDLAWFHKGSLTVGQNRLLDPGCGILNLVQCNFTPEWKAFISSNPGRFLAGVDIGTNSEYRDEYQAREVILRTALGSLDANDVRLIAAFNLQELSGHVPVVADGDINRDGVVNVADSMLGLQALLDNKTLSSLEFRHADVAPLSSGTPAPDRQFTLGDLQVILGKALGQISF